MGLWKTLRNVGSAALGGIPGLLLGGTRDVRRGTRQALGLQQYDPNYSEASRYYERMMDTAGLEQLRQSRLAGWRQMQQRAFGDIAHGVASRWGGTGANVAGIESSLPAQWETQAGTRWMQDVGTPGMRSIEQEFLQGQQQRQMMAIQGEQALRNRAEAEARGKSGWLSRLLGQGAGMAAGMMSGNPMAMMSGSGNPMAMNYQSPSYNPYFDPQWMNMQGNPMYQNQGQWT